MKSHVDELTRMVDMMPPELAREVLNFARFLHRKHTQEADASDLDDDSSRWGEESPAVHPFEDWDAVPERPSGHWDPV